MSNFKVPISDQWGDIGPDIPPENLEMLSVLSLLTTEKVSKAVNILSDIIALPVTSFI